jgi:YD repeat-containing protein
MKTNKKIVWLLPLLTMLAGMAGAQSQSAANSDNFAKMVDFLPPPPNAAAMIKHAEITVNKNTGSPNVGISLYSLKGNKLSTTVSLGYSSTGLKVDDIASRVGMGFSLTAGGVITRTMRGMPDEMNTRSVPPGTLADNCGSYHYMNQIYESSQLSGYAGGYDSEPDLFNFSMNGVSGSFVFDNAMHPVLIPAEKYKVEYDFATGAPWNFKITTTDGIKYYFGGDGAVEKTKRESNCAKSFNVYLANAWYLKKIEHPNAETIHFTYNPHTYSYDNGVSETMHWSWMQIDAAMLSGENCVVLCADAVCPSAPPSSRCINKTKTQGVLLNTIFNNTGTLEFYYTTRADCDDKLVSEVRYTTGAGFAGKYALYYSNKQSNMSYVNETAPGHTFTPYLTDIVEYASDQVQSRTHHFEYNDAGARPPRLSFSQDHWGYFNGKVNSSFVPRPATEDMRTKFPAATANREADGKFAAKGMLSKVIYPTGGIDSIIYEPNQVKSATPGYRPFHEFKCSVTGADPNTTITKTNYFTIDNAQEVEIRINCMSSLSINDLTHHNRGTLQVKTSAGVVVFPTEVFAPGIYTRYIRNNGALLSPGTYTMIFTANGSAVSTNITVRYYPVTRSSPEKNTVAGGVRVQRILTGNPLEKGMTKRFYYGDINSLDESSLDNVTTPVYYKPYVRAYPGCVIQCGGGNTNAIQALCSLAAMYSGSLSNLYSYHSSPISYRTVVEGMGENFEGGGVQTKFHTRADARGYAIWGNELLESPLSNFSTMLNGKPLEELVFKKSAAGVVIPLKKTNYSYIVDTRNSRLLYGYNINKKYDIVAAFPSPDCPPASITAPYICGAFDVVKYDIMSYWTHGDTETQTLYDENGQNPITTISKSYYENELNQQLTKSETTNSKGELTQSIIKYPHDYATDAPYTSMINSNIITVPVYVQTSTAGLPVSAVKTNYTHAGNNNFVPASVEKSLKGGAMEPEGTIDLYDASGHVLQFTARSGVPTAIIWGYGNRYPVAQVVAATYAQAISQLTVTPDALQSLTGAALTTQLDNIRTGLPQARVTSYTYLLPAGVSSITDANNKTNSFEYDAFYRLVSVKDQDGNLVKKNEYGYAGANPASKLALYFNAELGQSFTCQSCVSGYQGGLGETYIVPAGKHFSFISQADADAKAQADMLANGQLHANKTGFCTNDICTGDGYKLINCICELGQIIPVSCSDIPNGNGTWNQVYKYKWSDNSTSVNYTRLMPACTGVDKKKIGCECVQGIKVSTDGWQNADGTWTCVYHWHWPDNTNSANYTEISAIPCFLFAD